MGGMLGLTDEGCATTFLHNCLTFTLEMDSRVTDGPEHLRVVVAGPRREQDLRVPASVRAALPRPGPVGRADAVGDRRGITRDVRPGVGPVQLDTTFTRRASATPAPHGPRWKPHLNVTAKGEETTAVLRLQHVVVQPGDPELASTGRGTSPSMMEQQGGTAYGTPVEGPLHIDGSAGWRDAVPVVGGGIGVDAGSATGHRLADWVPTARATSRSARPHGDRRETIFGTVSATRPHPAPHPRPLRSMPMRSPLVRIVVATLVAIAVAIVGGVGAANHPPPLPAWRRPGSPALGGSIRARARHPGPGLPGTLVQAIPPLVNGVAVTLTGPVTVDASTSACTLGAASPHVLTAVTATSIEFAMGPTTSSSSSPSAPGRGQRGDGQRRSSTPSSPTPRTLASASTPSPVAPCMPSTASPARSTRGSMGTSCSGSSGTDGVGERAVGSMPGSSVPLVPGGPLPA